MEAVAMMERLLPGNDEAEIVRGELVVTGPKVEERSLLVSMLV